MDKELAIALLEALKNGLHETGKDFPYRDEVIPPSKEALDMGIKYLKESIQLEEIKPKTGHWINIVNNHGTVIALRCSCCKKSPKHAIKSDFCPNCGTKMEMEDK